MQTVVAGLQLHKFLAYRTGHGIERFGEITDFITTAHRQGHIEVPGSDLTTGHRKLIQVARQPGTDQTEQQHRQHYPYRRNQQTLLQQGLRGRGQEFRRQPIVQPAVLLTGQDNRRLSIIAIDAVRVVLGDVAVEHRQWLADIPARRGDPLAGIVEQHQIGKSVLALTGLEDVDQGCVIAFGQGSRKRGA